ncbi:hypothetical protein EVAR_18167_1 [Eumeta japonica]|uniref:Uncharacterized protein n=1 Tax=Eumeta variegata TaxID=151549 RepID=A0A4C1UVA4_EUMVA|nr:hypothetical protein EVAR_18167_1 [Eumeta japonica]
MKRNDTLLALPTSLRKSNAVVGERQEILMHDPMRTLTTFSNSVRIGAPCELTVIAFQFDLSPIKRRVAVLNLVLTVRGVFTHRDLARFCLLFSLELCSTLRSARCRVISGSADAKTERF